ncbi:MAG: hypothetical protein AB1405_17755 [Bdellovibrionota bacterium]
MKRMIPFVMALGVWGAALGCTREKDEAPAPDVAAAAAPSEEKREPLPPGREPDYQYLAQIRRARDASKGKIARMHLKFNQKSRPEHVVMLATDGSYGSTTLHYAPEFAPMIDDMKPGYVYEIEFRVTGVSTGGQPQGDILAVDRRSAGPVPDQTRFLPAVEAVEKARELPPEVKEARREAMRKQLEGTVESIENKQEEIKQAAGQPSSQPPEKK